VPKQPVRKSVSGVDFNHAMLYTSDVGASLKFYVDCIGFKVVEIFEWQKRPVYARLKAPRGSGTLALHHPEPGQSVPPSDGVRLYFEVRELDKFCKKLEAAGVVIKKPPKLMPWGWMHAYLDDPDGHEISVYWAGAKRMRKSKMRP
jgi:catechol 2,3-dioxygenase-like lactoylglutathione lyase family enzyme